MINFKNYFMPAEWAEHERTLIEWPVEAALVWPDNFREVCEGYAEVARAIAAFEKVTMLVNPESKALAEELCGPEIDYVTIPHNDGWCRDNGPTFLVTADGHRAAVSWQFNAWGEKYTPYDLDNAVAAHILTHLGVPFGVSSLVMEGGSIHTDGQGTLLTTRECLLNTNRNPLLGQEEIEAELKNILGVSKLLWLNLGLAGDETDGHVDNVACFAAPGIVLIQTCHDPDDENYQRTQENLTVLRNAADARGRTLDIIEIPQPPARYYEGNRLTLSYLNFYMVNGGIILPVFGGDATEHDHQAAHILKKAFPDRAIVPVDGMKLVKEGGNVHCITQQMPAAGILEREDKATV